MTAYGDFLKQVAPIDPELFGQGGTMTTYEKDEPVDEPLPAPSPIEDDRPLPLPEEDSTEDED